MGLSTLYAVNTGTVLIDQIVAQNLDPALNFERASGDGDPRVKHISLMGGKPVIGLTSLALARTLAALGATGVAIAGGANDAEFFLQKMLQDGTREGTLKHEKWTVNAGLFVPRSLRATHDSFAEIECECHARYDGTNLPVAVTALQSLAGSPAADEYFTVGPVKINGVDLGQVEEITVDFGLEVISRASDGNIWPTEMAIGAIAPEVTIRGLDANVLATFGLGGTAQGVTDSVLYFRKKVEGGANEPDASAVHIAISIAKGNISVESVGGANNDPAESVLKITPVHDGANEVLAISTGSAIV